MKNQIPLGLDCEVKKKPEVYKAKDYIQFSLDELKKKKIEYLKKADALFKPVAKMTKEDFEIAMKPGLTSKLFQEYMAEVHAIEKAERKIVIGF